MLVVVLGIASLPEVQDVENVPDYAEWLAEPNYAMLHIRPDALMVAPTLIHSQRYGLPFNPSATALMWKFRPGFLDDIHGNALVVGVDQKYRLTDCPLDILLDQTFE